VLDSKVREINRKVISSHMYYIMLILLLLFFKLGDARSRAALHVDENNVVTGVFTSNGEEFTLEVRLFIKN
jgi:hypothetical protein